MEQKFDIPYLKQVLYSGILCDVLDQKGYRNQALSNEIMGLRMRRSSLDRLSPALARRCTPCRRIR